MPTSRTLAVLGTTLLLAACGGGDAAKKKNAGKEEAAANTDGGGDGKGAADGGDEFVKGDKPIEVAGSFLYDCELGKKIDEEHSELGCKGSEAPGLTLTASQTEWSVVDEAKKKLDVARLDATKALGGQFEVVFKMPTALYATASIQAVRDGKDSTKPLKTILGLSPEALKCLMARPSLDCLLNDPLTPGTAKTSLTFDGLVDANFIDLPIIGSAAGATVGTYCDEEGIAPPVLFGVLGGPKREARPIVLDGDTCFARFDTAAQALSDNFFNDLYRYDGGFIAGPKRKTDGAPFCFFVLLGKKGQSGTRLHIMHNPAAIAGSKGVSAGDLLATLAAHRCK